MTLPGIEPVTIVLKSAILTFVLRSYYMMRNLYNIYYIYVVAVLLHIESRCRLDLRNNSLHHFIIHRNLRLNSSKSN